MADNVVLASAWPGGVSAATDDVAGLHFQKIKLFDGAADSTAGVSATWAQGLLVDVSRLQGVPAISGLVTTSGVGGNVSAQITNQPSVSAQLSAGGAVSAFTAGQGISAFTAGQAISAYTAGQLLSAWAVPAGQLSAWTLGGAASAIYNAPNQVSAMLTDGTNRAAITATSALLISAAGGGVGVNVPSAMLFDGTRYATITATSALFVSAAGAGTGTPVPSAMLFDGTRYATITAASALFVSAGGGVSAFVTNHIAASAQLSGGGAVSAFTAGQAISAFTAGQAISAFTAGQLLSAWAVPAGQLTASAQLSAGGAVSAFTAGQAISAWTAGQAISAWPAGVYAVSGTAISAWVSATLMPAFGLSSVGFETSATSAIISGIAASSVYVYAVKVGFEDYGGWHRWAASGAAVSGIEGYQRVDAFGGYVEGIMPPAFLFKTSAGAGLAFQTSSMLSAAAGRVSYWQT